jgi:cyanate permease
MMKGNWNARKDNAMKQEAADTVVGVMMIPMGLLGLLIAARAVDTEFYIFGLSLTVFAALFGFSLIKRHYDLIDAAIAASRHAGSDHGLERPAVMQTKETQSHG